MSTLRKARQDRAGGRPRTWIAVAGSVLLLTAGCSVAGLSPDEGQAAEDMIPLAGSAWAVQVNEPAGEWESCYELETVASSDEQLDGEFPTIRVTLIDTASQLDAEAVRDCFSEVLTGGYVIVVAPE